MKLKELLKDTALSIKELREAYFLIWKSDLIHILVEVLREDFSSIHGQWYTAAELASLLGNVCTSVQPKKAQNISKVDSDNVTTLDPSNEEIEEYYEILLPTAIDSLLILANSIHELDIDNTSLNFDGNLDHFKVVSNALLRICSVHSLCIPRVLQSPYLLHSLVSDHQSYSLNILSLLHELVKQDKQVIGTIPIDTLQSLLDELVFKIGGTEKELGILSLRLLALFSSGDGSIFELISERYKGLSLLLPKWSDTSLDVSLQQFITTLLNRVKVSDEEYKRNKAAIIIQAGWKGYSSRMKLLKAKRGIQKFQKLYRQRKTKQQQKESTNHTNRSNKLAQEITKMQSLRQYHEQQRSILEQMPASSVNKYLTQQENIAAMKIQSWWRGEMDRRMINTMKVNKKKEESATLIQRAYKKHLRNKTSATNEYVINTDVLFTMSPCLPPLTIREREQLESEVASIKCQSLHESEKQDSERNIKTNDLLEWFYSSRKEQREADRKRSFLMTQVPTMHTQTRSTTIFNYLVMLYL